MQTPVLMDKLSEFLMVEQGGLQLYRVAASRCTDPLLRDQYLTYAQETLQHRELLVRLIEQLGGDPSYVSPTARLAQAKGARLLELSFLIDGLSQAELEAGDLENLLLAETKDHADWQLLSQLAPHVEDPNMQRAFRAVVDEVEAQEDAHLDWARQTLSKMCRQLVLQGPAPTPERWQMVISGPVPPIDQVHPAPMQPEDGLLPPAAQSPWQDAPSIRAARGR